MKVYAAGVDIGGTNTKTGIITDKGEVYAKASFKTSDFSTPELFTEKLSSVIKKSAHAAGSEIRGIGIGAPNGSSITGCLEYAPNLPWEGRVNITDMLKKEFPDITVKLTNDANAAALGEKLFGAAADFSDFIVVTLGTGVGGGIFSSSRLLEGRFGLAGEIGHVNAVLGGRLCGCGRKGCVEAYCSAGGIIKTAQELLKKDKTDSILRKLTLEQINTEKIHDAAVKGDTIAVKVFDKTAKILASFLADLVHILSVEAFIVTGGISGTGKVLFKPLEKYFSMELMKYYRDKNIRIIKSSLPDQDAAIIGAASLVLYN